MTRVLMACLLLSLMATPCAAATAFVDTLQNGLHGYAGCFDAEIDTTLAGNDSTQFGAAQTAVIGSAGSAIHRYLIKFVFGSETPSDYLQDSTFLELNRNTGTTTDTLLAAIVLQNWTEGAGDGTREVPLPGVTWRNFSRVTLPTDSLWTEGGADSGAAFVDGRPTPTARAQASMGNLNYSGDQDRTAWIPIGALTGSTGLKRFNVTELFRFLTHDIASTNNWGLIIRQQTETTGATDRMIVNTADNGTQSLRPKLIRYYHRTSGSAIRVGRPVRTTRIHQ